MISINSGTKFKTKVQKGNISANVIVSVSNPKNRVTSCIVRDAGGNESEYLLSELMGFGYLKKSNTLFDIVEDLHGSQDKFGNKDILIGCVHLTKNVRSGLITFKFWEDCLYAEPGENVIWYDYVQRELSDEEVIKILFDEILYGVQPDLQSTSLVGTSVKGIDKDPNYHDGNYMLPNGKEYTMTWCRGKVKIREGKDGGWYPGSSSVGRTLHEGEMDWNKYKDALIRKGVVYQLSRGIKLLEEIPEIEKLIYDKIKGREKYKLNDEFVENL